MRRVLALLLLLTAAAAAPLAASAQPASSEPLVDVVEIAGVIDRPLERYLLEQIDEAERARVALLVFQVDSLGAMKVVAGERAPAFVERLAGARVPVAVHVGPRGARAAGVVLLMMAAADVASVGPSARVGPLRPVDVAAPDSYAGGLAALGRAFSPSFDPSRVYGANAAVNAGVGDFVVPSVAEMLVRANGREVATADGSVTLALPRDAVVVRFHQPGPIRRLLHTFSNATLVYIMLLAGAMLLVFELFQPGFGVAGVTAGLLLAASGYGLTVLPADAFGLGVLLAGLLLLGADVALDKLGPLTVLGAVGVTAGSVMVLDRGHESLTIPLWVIVAAVASCLIMFVPVMTVVRRARKPISVAVRRELIGETGRVRSMLNPEGFIAVRDEIWRARSEDGRRMRVGEDVVVVRVEGTVLMVTAAGSDAPVPNGSGAPTPA